MSFRLNYYIFLLLLFVIITGCSGGKGPILPSDTGSKIDTPNSSPISESADPDPFFSTGLLGVFSVHIDPVNLIGELVPFRGTASKDVLEVVDISNFLSLAPCSNCVKIYSVELDSSNHITVNIGIRHPFPVGDPLKPTTGRNRLDLHIFNIEGIVAMTSGDSDSFPGLNATVDANVLLNSSGYTGYLDAALDEVLPTEANIHPYILHFRDYTNGNYDPANPNGFADVLHPTGYLVMPMGSDVDIQPYTFDLTSTDSFNFTYAVGCTYGISADNKSQRMSPAYRLPQFNKKAASEVAVEIATNDLHPAQPSSSAVLRVKVLDMNQGVAVGDGLGEMRAESNVASISVEVTGVTSSPVVVANPTATGGEPRNPANPLTFEVTINNSASGPMGIFRGLVKVTDSYPTGLNEAPTLGGKDGINRVVPLTSPLTALFAIPEFATYQAFSIEVGGNVPPLADIDASSQTVDGCNSIQLFPGPGTHDPDGSIVLYEYDFNYDGTNFDIDASNTTGLPVTTSPLSNTTSAPINIDMAMRVTDNGTPPMTDIDVITITVNTFWLEIGFISTPAEVLSTPFGYHGVKLDPALCQEDDGQYAMAYIYKEYSGAGTGDTVLGLHSPNGITWTWTQGMIGTSGINSPLKFTKDRGDVDSYAYFGCPASLPGSAFIAKSTGDPYEYTWFDVPFQHSCELYCSLADSHVMAFGDANDRIERRRSTTAHTVSWPSGFTDLVTITVSDPDPRLSDIRSIGEDSSGLMFLAYFNSTESAIRSIKSTDMAGSAWTEQTIWTDTSGTYTAIRHPGVDVDSNNTINVSFVRHNGSTNVDEACYTKSTDGGTTFTTPVIAVSGTGPIRTTPIVYLKKFNHDIIAIAYENNGDIMLALSCNYGYDFKSGLIISNLAQAERNPDIIVDRNNDLIVAWELDDATYHGTIYSCKLSVNKMP